LVNYTTRERKNFIAPEVSINGELLQFTVTEVGASAQDLLTGNVSISPFGRYTLEVYEQVSTTNLDEALATFLGDDELMYERIQTYDAPPPRNPITLDISTPACTLVVTDISTTDETFEGAGNGTATANITGAIGNITYLWNDDNNQTTETATDLVAGIYLCTVSDDVEVGCSDSDSGTVSNTVSAPTTLVLFGDDAASINSGVSSIDDPVTLWSDRSSNGNDAGQSIPSAKPLWKGTYLQGDGNDWMTLSKVISKIPNRSIYVVFMADATGINQNVYGDIEASGMGSTTSMLLGLRSTGELRSTYGDGVNARATNSTTSYTTNVTLYSDRFSSNSGSPNVTMEIDGNAETEIDFSGIATGIAGTEANFSLFRLGDIASANLTGRIYDVVLFSTELGSSDNTAVTDFLKTKHNIT
jgi:hypothetical protein